MGLRAIPPPAKQFSSRPGHAEPLPGGEDGAVYIFRFALVVDALFIVICAMRP